MIFSHKKTASKAKLFLLMLVAFLITLPATKPLFEAKFYHMHDFTHVARLAELDRAIQDGHFPVRWSKNFGFGYGMPLFNFYGPTPFYIAQFFHLFTIPYLESIKLVIFLTFIVGFIAMFYLARDYWGNVGGLISATAFIYAPYRAVDTYIRGSINELYGITFTILALLAIHKAIKHNATKWFILCSVFMASMITSHNITALFSIPAIALFTIALIKTYPPKNLTRTLLKAITTFLLALTLSAFYAIPAYLQKDSTAISRITSGYFHYSQHFLYLRQFLNSPWGYGGSIYGLEDGLSFEIGKIHLALFVMGMASLLISKHSRPKFFWIIGASVLIVGISMLMATFKTQALWDNLKILQFIQFPWRFLSLIIIFVSFIAGAAVTTIKQIKLPPGGTSIALILILILYNQSFFKPEKYLDTPEGLYYSDAKGIQEKMSSTLPDYLPPGVDYEKLTPPSSRFQLQAGGEVTSLSSTIDRTHEFLVEVNLTQPSTFIANIFDFPGWQFYVNDQQVQPTLSRQLPVYQIDLDPQQANANKVYVSGIFTETPMRSISNTISILTIMILVYVWLKSDTKEKHA